MSSRCPHYVGDGCDPPHKVIGEWLVEQVDECTCGSIDIGVGIQHEPHCGWEPIEKIAALARADERGRER